MGKPTGFMEYARQENPAVEPEKRIGNFNEFHPMISLLDRQMQGARCMDCGVPFCQSGMNLGGAVSGCPLHNLIPEWNDMIYHCNWEHALQRLLKTNNFPEFTGRVCPALCEAACTCGMHDMPVTIKENELAIIENGFRKGLVKPMRIKVRSGKRVAIVGSGPSGLAAADQLNHRGHTVTVYEKEDRPGGLLMYGIPNMKLEKQVVTRRVNLMREEGVEFITGADVGRTVDAGRLLSEYDAVLMCCGAGNPRDLNLPGRDLNGIHFAVDFLKSTTRSLLNSDLQDGAYISAKDRNVVIVGGGDTGNDCVGTAIRHGCKSVVQIEMMPKPPVTRAANNPWPQWPRVLKVDYGQQESIAVFGRDPRIYQTTIKEFIGDESGHLKAVRTVRLNPERDDATGRMRMVEIPGTEEVMEADLLLIAAGFLGCTPYVAEAFGAQLNERTNVRTEPGMHATGVEKLFVAGDMHRGQSLVVWAITEGRSAAREIDQYLMGYTNLSC